MKNKNNWHTFEEGILCCTWLSEQEADEWIERHRSCFPGISFYALRLDSLHGMTVGGIQND